MIRVLDHIVALDTDRSYRVNINALSTYQQASSRSRFMTVPWGCSDFLSQIILYLVPFIANPIFINTCVVFVRLYWFEKRFQNVVKTAREWRRSRTRSRTVTENRKDNDPDREERGVNGRDIVVLRSNNHANGYPPKGTSDGKDKDEQMPESGSSSTSLDEKNDRFDGGLKGSSLQSPPARAPSFQRDITFADELKPINTRNTTSLYVPLQLSAEQHIAILENQRNPKDTSTLRIPGPRDFDRGDLPETLDHGVPADDHPDKLEAISEWNSNEHHPVKRNITIDEPNHPRSRTRTSTMPKLNHKTGSSNHRSFSVTPSSAQIRQRTGTFSSNRSSRNKDKDKEIPYLSWQPTIGRNSAFIDLTEEQREELGGIEYRALKTLALVLVCKYMVRELSAAEPNLVHLAYFVFFHIFGVICLVPWIVRSGTYGPIVDEVGVTRAWWFVHDA